MGLTHWYHPVTIHPQDKRHYLIIGTDALFSSPLHDALNCSAIEASARH